MAATYTEGDEPVPGYRLIGLLGWGRFGEVWKASAPGGFEAALKFISLSNKHGANEYRAIGMFKQIRHPNLVPLTGKWLKDKQGTFIDEAVIEESCQLQEQAAELILAMGLGDRNLYDRLKECQEKLNLPAIPDRELLGYMEQVASILDYLHQPIHDFGRGPVAIQHCDIKPHNILIVGMAAQLCDLGVARILEDSHSTTAMGSAAYIAPECISNGRPSAATDQYSLAITYTELRTGVLPIAARSIAAAYMAHMNGKIDLSRLPQGEQEVIGKATAIEPGARFPDIRTMVNALRQAMDQDQANHRTVIPALKPIPAKVNSDDELEFDAENHQASNGNPVTMILRNGPVVTESDVDWPTQPALAAGSTAATPAPAVVPAEPELSSEPQLRCSDQQLIHTRSSEDLVLSVLPLTRKHALFKPQLTWVLVALATLLPVCITWRGILFPSGHSPRNQQVGRESSVDNGSAPITTSSSSASRPARSQRPSGVTQGSNLSIGDGRTTNPSSPAAP